MKITYNPKTKQTLVHTDTIDLTPKKVFIIGFYLQGHLINAYSIKTTQGWLVIAGWHKGLEISRKSIQYSKVPNRTLYASGKLIIKDKKVFPLLNEIQPPNLTNPLYANRRP